MALVVGGVVGHRANSKGVLVNVLRIAQQAFNEVTASDVVCQVAEELAAVGIVAHVLDDRPTVRVGMGSAKLVSSGVRKPFLKERLDMRNPDRVNDCLVRKHGVSIAGGRQGEEQHQNRKRENLGSCYPRHGLPIVAAWPVNTAARMGDQSVGKFVGT